MLEDSSRWRPVIKGLQLYLYGAGKGGDESRAMSMA